MDTERFIANVGESGSRMFDEAINGWAAERRDIYDRWLGFLGRNLFTYTLSSSTRRDSEFRINAHCRGAGGFGLARFTTVRGKSQLFRRPAEIGADNRNGYVLYMPLQGAVELEQFHRKHLYEPRQVVLVSASDQLVHTKLGDNDTLCFRMPREFVDQRVICGESLCTRLIQFDKGISRLLVQTMLAFEQEASTLTKQEFLVTARLVGEMALLALENSETDVGSNIRSVRTANLARVKRMIRMHYTDHDLTLTNIANACGISLRYLHDLFREDGRTAREYLQGERLQHARHMLESESDGTMTVTAVSFACGFVNSSQFSTAFRHAFGLSPRDVLRRR